MARQQAAITKIEQRGAQFSAQQTALTALEATVLSLQTSADSLVSDANYSKFKVSGAGDSVSITAGSKAVPGDYSVRAVRLASTHAMLSRGFASATGKVGPGTVTIRTGGELAQDSLLETLNGGEGIRGGTIRLTDRNGETAKVDLSAVVTVSEAMEAINSSGLDIVATVHDDHIQLTDSSGGAGDLIVEDLTGTSAAGLGIAGTVTADTLTGSSIFSLTDDFTFGFLDGGLKPRTTENAEDFRITATDGTQIDVNLDDAESLADVVSAINDAANNGGKVTAQLTNGRLELVDSAGGGGTLTVEDLNDSSVIEVFGLSKAAVGNTLTGYRLNAGLNGSLLRNLNGGQGIDTPGEISVTDRAGETATLDLSNAETLQEVIDAINGATSAGLVKLQIEASINDTGTGIVIRDTSGGGGNLTIADTTGTVATDLGIAVDAAVDEFDGGPLNRRFVNEATSISNYAPGGEAPATGQIQITDSSGNAAAINITSAVKTIGDVIQRINANTTINVRAELNDTGDGFVLIDEAGGGGTLSVQELDSTTAADLRLLGDSYTGTDGKQRISSRFAAVIELDADDTLEDFAAKLSEQASFANAQVLNDGSSLNPFRLAITSATSGRAGRLVIESDFNLGLLQTSAAEDAVAQIGPGGGIAFLATSSTNIFLDAVADLDISLIKESSTAENVTVARDFTTVKTALKSFVSNYNSLNDAIGQATKFSIDSEERGVLQGNGFVLRIQSRLNSLVAARHGESGNSVRTLADLGITFSETGTMQFDETRFDEISKSDPDALAAFFDGDDGFGAEIKTFVEDLTDSTTGSFTIQKNALQNSVDEIEERTDRLRELMLARRERYLLEFAQMETILSSLDAQSQAISALTGNVSQAKNSS